MTELIIDPQPNDETCGATCLHAVYRYYGYDIPLKNVIASVTRSASGGTLAPFLGIHALNHGFQTLVYTNNLKVFDLTWFASDPTPPAEFLLEKLRAQEKFLTDDPDTLQITRAYETYLTGGGKVQFQILTIDLLKQHLQQHQPIITGLSSTYLYQCMRECFTEAGESISDDIHGTPCGHFVVLRGFESKKNMISIADPYRKNPISHTNYYMIPITQVLNSILLGVFTYDANLLIITAA